MSIISALSGRMTDKQLAELRERSAAARAREKAGALRPEVRSSSRDRMPQAELDRVKAQGANVTEESDLLLAILSGDRTAARKARKALERWHKPKKIDQMVAAKAKELRPKENKGWFSW